VFCCASDRSGAIGSQRLCVISSVAVLPFPQRPARCLEIVTLDTQAREVIACGLCRALALWPQLNWSVLRVASEYDITNEHRSETRSNKRKQLVAMKIMYYTTRTSTLLVLRGDMSQSWQDESAHHKNTACVISSPKSFGRARKKPRETPRRKFVNDTVQKVTSACETRTDT
jgi:hypothetical protein